MGDGSDEEQGVQDGLFAGQEVGSGEAGQLMSALARVIAG